MNKEIKILLIKKNMLLKDLADKINISLANLSQQLKRNNFTINDLEKIAAALDCKLKIEFIENDNK